MYKQVLFTREDLYQMVWDRPVLLIAKDIGISDVALAKACRRSGIPLPQRGHWAVVKSGRKVKTPALPARKATQPEVVQFSVLENPQPRPPKSPQPVVPPIEVPAVLAKPHPLVAELKAAAGRAEEDKGVLVLNYQKVLRVRVSSQRLPRALILLDILIKQLEMRGYRIEIGGAHKETELLLNEGQLSFRLDERTTQQTPPAAHAFTWEGTKPGRRLRLAAAHVRPRPNRGIFAPVRRTRASKRSWYVERQGRTPLRRSTP